ncbi:MAG: nucleotide exchange factor GrpE [Clostridia bacterium]|nr:nucleotide exchange factor GrpE [Clostridia bacterium]
MTIVAKTKKEETKVDENKEVEDEKDNASIKIQKELEEKNDQLLRLAAEYDNFRKRSQREKESIYSDVKANVLGDLLPVIDNFERALDGSGDELESFRKGVDMIFNQLVETMKKHGVESFGEVGDEFDPNFHSAVMHIESEDLGENVIAQVFSKGYKVGDKVIRPATVQVAN